MAFGLHASTQALNLSVAARGIGSRKEAAQALSDGAFVDAALFCSLVTWISAAQSGMAKSGVALLLR